jgi:hypothetical protein
MLGVRQRSTGMVLGFQCREPRARIFLGRDVLFGTGDGGISRIQLGGRTVGRAGNPGSRNRLARVAHLLHGRTGAADEACNSDKYRNEAQHRGHGH